MFVNLNGQTLQPLNADTLLFSLEDIIFARCGLCPSDRKKSNVERCFKVVYKDYGNDRLRYVNESEKLTLQQTYKLLTLNYLGWISNGKYDHDNPLSTKDGHSAYMNSYAECENKQPDSLDILKIESQGVILGIDYSAILHGLKTKYLVSSCLISDVHYIEKKRDELKRDLTGKEVHSYIYEKGNMDYKADLRAKGEFERGNIAIYFAANNIHSQFDFGQKTILANSMVIDSEKIMKGIFIPETQEYQMLLAFLHSGGVIKRKLSGWGFARLKDFAATKRHGDVKTIRKGMINALNHFERMHKKGEPLPDEIKNIDAIWRGLEPVKNSV
jgi:hypothetical protein